MYRIYILIAFGFVTYYGYDGMRGDSSLRTLSVTEIENGGVGDSRFIEITDCYTSGAFVYEYEDNNKDAATSVIFPVISSESFLREVEETIVADSADFSTEFIENEKIKTHILIKRNTARFDPSCAAGDGTCTKDLTDFILEGEELRGFTVRGTTLLGLDEMDSRDRELIQSLNYEIADNVVFLEEDAEPKGTALSLLMIVAGILGMLITIGSWFMGRTSSDEPVSKEPPKANI